MVSGEAQACAIGWGGGSDGDGRTSVEHWWSSRSALSVSLLERVSLEQSLLWSRPSEMVAQGERQEFASVAIAAVMRVPLFAHILLRFLAARSGAERSAASSL